MNDFLLKYLRNLGTQNTNSGERWNPTKKPAIGGITFYICFLLATISLVYTSPKSENFDYIQFYGLMIAITVGFLSGLFDDAYNTIPWLKLLLQIVCGVILILTGTYIQISESYIVNIALTLFWVVGIMNAINLLDNMDAIASIVSFFIICVFMMAVFAFDQTTDHYFLILLGTALSLISFLRYNKWPSKMYMGDTGSMFLGILLAAFGIIHLWNFTISNHEPAPVIAKLMAVACVFALPIIDTTSVFVKRLFVMRKSPFKGGKDHTTHHLSYLGISDQNVALIFAGLSIINAIMGILILLVANKWNSFHTLAFGSWFVLEFSTLFVISHLNITKDETE